MRIIGRKFKKNMSSKYKNLLIINSQIIINVW